MNEAVMTSLREGLVLSIKGYIAREVEALSARLAAVEKQEPSAAPTVAEIVAEVLKQLPAPVNGKDGENGKDGKDAHLDIDALVKTIADGIPVPRDGKDGESGKDGENGKDAEFDVDAIVKTITASIQVPKDGKDADETLIVERVTKAVLDATVVEKVEIDLDAIAQKAAALIEPAKDGVDGRDGEDGRDALDLEIFPEIDESKSYPRGSYAKHANGFWRSFERTFGMRGWECLVAGEADFSVEHTDDSRSFTLRRVLSDGEVKEFPLRFDAMSYRGTWSETTYLKGDVITFGGSMWHANEETTEKPIGSGKTWTLCVKKGADGKVEAPPQPHRDGRIK